MAVKLNATFPLIQPLFSPLDSKYLHALALIINANQSALVGLVAAAAEKQSDAVS